MLTESELAALNTEEEKKVEVWSVGLVHKNPPKKSFSPFRPYELPH